MTVFTSQRLAALAPNAFAALEEEIAAARAAGVEVIDMGRSDPDHPPSPAVRQALCTAAQQPSAHRYPPYAGRAELREAVAAWYRQRHGVLLDPASQVLVLPGSRQGLFHLPWAVCDRGDVVLIPDPSFPVYRVGAYLAGTEVVPVPLAAADGYLPRLWELPAPVLHRSRLLFLNYPHNPTGAVAPHEFLRYAVDFARRRGLVLCSDLTYSESGYRGYRPPSVLAIPGALEVAVEFITWSKNHSLAGWRVAAVAGNREVVAALARLEQEASAGVFAAVQHAAAVALANPGEESLPEVLNRVYERRLDRLIEVLRSLRAPVARPRATPYLWVPIPEGVASYSFARALLRRAGIAVVPGSAFGARGEGFVRFSLTVPDARLDQAVARLHHLGAEGWAQLGRQHPPAGLGTAVGRRVVSRPRDAGTGGPSPRGTLPEEQLLSSL